MDGAGTTRMLRLLVVDDHELVRRGIVALIGRSRNLEVVAEAASAAEAVSQAATWQPDLVVMDVRLPDGSGIEATREIRAANPATRVVMLTSYADEEAVFASIVAGASGYVLKQIRGRDLVAALEAVGRGASLLDPAVTRMVLQQLRQIAGEVSPDGLATLTAHEREILAGIAEGQTNREIATSIGLSEKTVKHAVTSILGKLHLRRRTQVAAYLARHPLPRDYAAV